MLLIIVCICMSEVCVALCGENAVLNVLLTKTIRPAISVNKCIIKGFKRHVCS